MRVVSNSSALVNLARIGRLDLLATLHGELMVPQAVWHEAVVRGAGLAGAAEVEHAPWIRSATVANQALVLALTLELDAGEAEAIALATEQQADLLLMDERLGREVATRLGIWCLGLVGVLVHAKRPGAIEALRPLLDALRDVAGFRLSESLYRRVLQDVGEA